MPHIRWFVARRRIALIGGILLVAVAAIAVITAVAAQNTGAKPTVRPYIASMPPEKRDLVPLQETKTAEYVSAHPDAAKIPATITHAPPVQGIQYKYPNAWNMHLRFENEWFGNVNGQSVAVFAGSFSTVDQFGKVTEDRQQGYVAVAMESKGGVDTDYHEYLTPTKHGAVKITAVNGTQVSLIATDGSTITFDLTTRTFS